MNIFRIDWSNTWESEQERTSEISASSLDEEEECGKFLFRAILVFFFTGDVSELDEVWMERFDALKDIWMGVLLVFEKDEGIWQRRLVEWLMAWNRKRRRRQQGKRNKHVHRMDRRLVSVAINVFCFFIVSMNIQWNERIEYKTNISTYSQMLSQWCPLWCFLSYPGKRK